MKNTKIMVACIAIYLITWLFISVIGWTLTDTTTLKQCATSGVTLTILLMVGWIPSTIVAIDLDSKLEHRG